MSRRWSLLVGLVGSSLSQNHWIWYSNKALTNSPSCLPKKQVVDGETQGRCGANLTKSVRQAVLGGEGPGMSWDVDSAHPR